MTILEMLSACCAQYQSAQCGDWRRSADTAPADYSLPSWAARIHITTAKGELFRGGLRGGISYSIAHPEQIVHEGAISGSAGGKNG